MELLEIISPAFRDTAPVVRARSVINGANAVPTHKKTGAKIVHRIIIRIRFPPVTRNAGTARAMLMIPANGRISLPGRNIENNSVIGTE